MMLAATLFLASVPSAGLAGRETGFRIDQGRLEVRVTFGTRGGWFMLDSAGPTVIDPSFFGNGARPSGSVTAEKMQVGGATLKNVEFRVASRSLMNRIRMGAVASFDGVLGYDVLRLTSLAVDFDRCRAWIWGPHEGQSAKASFFRPGESIQSLPLLSDVNSKWSTVKLRFEPCEVDAAIDLGSTLGSLPSYVQASLAKRCSSGETTLSIQQLDRTSEGRFLAPNRVWMGATELDEPLFCTDHEDRFPPILGWTNFAAMHRVLLDFDGGQLVLPAPAKATGFIGFLQYVSIQAVSMPDQPDDPNWTPVSKWLQKHPSGETPVLADGLITRLVAKWAAELLPTHKRSSKKRSYLAQFRSENGPLPISRSLAKTTSDFNDGVGYYVVPADGAPTRVSAYDGPYRFAFGEKKEIVEVGGLPLPRPMRDPFRREDVIYVSPVVVDADADHPPSPAYKLPDGKHWLMLSEHYDSPIHLPMGAQVNVPSGWAKLDDIEKTGELILYPPGVKPAGG